MKLLTREEMQWIEHTAIEKYGVPSLALMENAGQGIAKFIQLNYPLATFPKIAVFCGKGNNGGDGFVIARLLHEAGCSVRVFILARENEYQGDAKINLNRLPFPATELTHPHALRAFSDEIKNSSLIIDAIFGVGLDRPVNGFTADVIRFLNLLRLPVIAVDIPSGLCANTGKVLGEALMATQTLTLHRPKLGLAFGEDAAIAGNIFVLPIGIPENLDERIQRKMYLITPKLFQGFFKPRKRFSHKGNYGHVLTLAGSRTKIGAALLCARAALRAGAGLSTLALPDCAYQKIDPRFSEIMFEPQISDGDFFSSEALFSVLKLVSKKSSIALGPGLGVSEGLKFLIKSLIEKIKLRGVLDADAINNLDHKNLRKISFDSRWILTPHPGEMARLLQITISELMADRIENATAFAKKHQVFLLLKGYRSLIACPDGSLYVNSTGNPGMATAGMGDVLTGVIAGFLAQGFPPFIAALAGSWIHGRAGDLVAQERGEAGMVAWDVGEKIPSAIFECLHERN